jgi:hypothetical protein
MGGGSAGHLSSVWSGSGGCALSRGHATIDECASAFHLYSAAEIRCLDHQTLHRLLSSESLSIESEDWLLGLLIDSGLDRSEFFSHLEIQFLTSTGISRFTEELEFESLTADIWTKVVNRLKCENRSVGDRRIHSRIDSSIVKIIPPVLRDIGGKSWTLLYRGSRDGFGSSTFHSKCDGQTNTITLIESTEGYVFGGFTPISWDSSESYKSDISCRSFVFSVKNPHGRDGCKFPVSRPVYAIYCNSSYGPTFGNHSIYVADGCDGNTKSYTCLGLAYANTPGIADDEFFTGALYFKVKQIEVFSITEPVR